MLFCGRSQGYIFCQLLPPMGGRGRGTVNKLKKQGRLKREGNGGREKKERRGEAAY